MHISSKLTTKCLQMTIWILDVNIDPAQAKVTSLKISST
jgi:hypothetical protein